jgi:murein DD-endopeptidase MepM/ murein hydrolase activator NlpD
MSKLAFAAVVVLAGALTMLVPAVLSAPAANASFAPSSALADAPQGLVTIAVQAGHLTQQDPNVLLAIAKVETTWGKAQNGQPDDLVPADLQAHIDAGALQPGGATAALLGLAGGRRLGDWVNPQAVGAEHAMGFMQFLPSTWRTEAAAAPGRPQDPYRPLDSMVTAGSYLARLETGADGGTKRSLHDALAVYGGDSAYADNILALAGPPAAVGPVGHTGLAPISCPGIRLTQGYGPTDLIGEPIINGVRFHTGWDLACPAGTPVVSVTAGKAHVGFDGSGFGNYVQVQVGDLWVRYAHLETVLVSNGDQVAAGTLVGLEGSTGFSTGPHLHFEVDRGCPAVTCSIDPSNLISLPGRAAG